MFVLGIMVGRGNSPVSFDTQSFQDRLEKIAGEFGQQNETQKEVDLEFFKVLDRPADQEKSLPKVTVPKTAKKTAAPVDQETIPLKTSTKKKTLQKKLPDTEKKKQKPVTASKKAIIPKKVTTTKKVSAPKKSAVKKAPVPKKKALYTIQVAAYREFKDAVSHMAMLDKKGISSYQLKGVKDGVTWYRVRCGAFATISEAKKYKEQLVKKKIKAMIIKKDSHEDI